MRADHEPRGRVLRFFGHNCFAILDDANLLLVDPWFSASGAFFGSWHQYPTNHALAATVEQLAAERTTSVYLTHEHQDHFDLAFLERLPNLAMTFVPGFADDHLSEVLSGRGIPDTRVGDQETVEVAPGLRLTAYLTDIGINHDSAVLVECESFRFFDQNDCKMFDRLDLLPPGTIDFYSVQFSGATWHPVCFDYPDDEKLAITAEKTMVKLRNVRRAIERIDPTFFVPAAGPAVFPFLDVSLSLGRDNIFVHQDRLDAYLRSTGWDRTLYPRPGDVVDGATDRTPILPPTAEEVAAMRAAVPDVWTGLPDDLDPTALLHEVEERLARIVDLELPPTPLLRFTWDREGEGLEVDLDRRTARLGPYSEADAFIELIAEPRYFALMHSGARWQDVYLSLRARVRRQPDVFSDTVNIFLFSDVSDIRSSFLSKGAVPSERVPVHDRDGRCYLVDRYCPHQGADLLAGTVNDANELVCPRHGWRFALDQGGTNARSTTTVNAVRVASADLAAESR